MKQRLWAGAIALVLMASCAQRDTTRAINPRGIDTSGGESDSLGRAGAVLVKDATGSTLNMRTSTVSGEHVPHHIVSDTGGDTQSITGGAAHVTDVNAFNIYDLLDLTMLHGDTVGGAQSRGWPGLTLRVTAPVSTAAAAGRWAMPLSDAEGRHYVSAEIDSPIPTGSNTIGTVNLGNVADLLTVTAFNARTPALGQALMAASTPVVLASNQSPVPISDNGGSITIDDGSGPITVDGTIAVNTMPFLETTALSAVASNVDADSTAFDMRGYGHASFEVAFSSTGANAGGQFSVLGGFQSSGIVGTAEGERRLRITKIESDGTCSFAGEGQSSHELVDVDFANGGGEGYCRLTVEQPPPFVVFRWDRDTGGSAAGSTGLTVRLFARAVAGNGANDDDNASIGYPVSGAVTCADTASHTLSGGEDLMEPVIIVVSPSMQGHVLINGMRLGAGQIVPFTRESLADITYECSQAGSSEVFSYSTASENPPS